MTAIRQLPLPNFDSGLARVLSSLLYDDALICGAYRVEFVKLTGRMKYRIFRKKRLVWELTINTPRKLPEMCYTVAFWLAQHGCESRYARKVEYGAVA